VNSTPPSVLAIVGGVAFVILAMIGAIAVYDAFDDDDMMGGMWDMMDDMGGMMGGDGMMGGRSGRGDETRGAASGQGEVHIADFDYEPSVLEVTPSTVVTWTNEDGAPHTATAQNDTFDTGRLDKGESGEISFDTPGIYEYICTFHPYMEGRVVVSSTPR
jgi:plastocyanin